MGYRKLLFSLLACALMPTFAVALPFNDDMVEGQLKPGQVMRSQASGSVAIGSLARTTSSREAARALSNPIKPDKSSKENGARLYTINCAPCHGTWKNGKHEMGISPLLPGPDLSMDAIAQKPDGHFYDFIHFGGMAIMPAYGFKLSVKEHWDIVNYLREVQRKG